MSEILKNEPAPSGGETLSVPTASPSATPTASTLLLRNLAERLRGDLGFLPVLATLIAIAIYFQITTNGLFLTPTNFSFLVLQTATISTLAIGVVPVLLLGEIDLSLAAVSTFCASLMSVLSERKGVPGQWAILVGILSGSVVGLINGFFIAVLRVPSFIVTLAGSLAYAGLVLKVLEPNTTLPVRNAVIRPLATSYLSDFWSITLPVVVLVIYTGGVLLTQIRRKRAGLKTLTTFQLLFQLALVVAISGGALTLFESYLGVPESGAIVMGLLLLMWVVLKRTAFGRHIYAVGGNAEAARRAGINVTGVRVSVFVIASTLAAIGGVLAVSRETAVASQIQPSLLLDSIAAAVIGGVSLFGGRGSVWAVVLGTLIIGSLENGLSLIGGSEATQKIVEGCVLLFAVTIDAFVRRANTRSGR